MPVTYHSLETSLLPGSKMIRPSTGYFVLDMTGRLALADADQPRFEYDPALAGSGYLCEPAHTNALSAPQDFTDPAWVHMQAPGDVSVDANIGSSPDDSHTADRLNFLAGSADVGLSQIYNPSGGRVTASIYIQRDTTPHDFRVRRPGTDVGAFNGTATLTWQRVHLFEQPNPNVDNGLYIRRNTGVGGTIRLWGAMAHRPLAKKILSFHPTTCEGDYLRLRVAAMGSATGSVGVDWIPRFNASEELNDGSFTINDPVAESTLMDWAHENDFRLAWASNVHAPTEAYLRLYNGGAVIATYHTRHASGDVLHVRIHYGGTETRPHLEVNGVLIKATAAWTEVEVPRLVAVGCNAAGTAQCFGVYRHVFMDTDRLRTVERFASLGDELSAEPYAYGTRSWNRRAGALLYPVSKQILVAGTASNKLADLTARVQADALDQGVSTVVVLAGYYDLISDRSLPQMELDAQDLIDAIHNAGKKVAFGTITPFKANAGWSAPREAIRTAFNAWLSSGAIHIDEVIDTAAAVKDGGDAALLSAAYDSGDGFHLNDAGSDAIAVAVMTILSPPTGVGNFSFELPGTGPGYAAEWAFSRTATLEDFSSFDSINSSVEDFGDQWRLPQTVGYFENEFSLFAFSDTYDLEFADFSALHFDGFEYGWKNDGGLIDNLDLVSTEIAAFDSTHEEAENFEHEWNLPHAVMPLKNEAGLGGFEEFFDAHSALLYPVSIISGNNDKLLIDFSPMGSPVITATIAAGSYANATTLAAAIQAAIDAEVSLIPGGFAGAIVAEAPAGVHFRLRITDADLVNGFRLREIATAPAWGTLRFTVYPLDTQQFRFRFAESLILTAAHFNTTLDTVEAFEREWRSNQNSIWAFIDGTHLEAAVFDETDESFEDFEHEWYLTLVL